MTNPALRARLLQAALLAALIPAAQAGEFVYQGQLDDHGAPANGRFDLRIAAFAGEQSPQTLLAPIEFPGVEVKDGRFELRFDAPLAGDREAWLEVAVRDAGAGSYAVIPGRSKALAAPLIGACWSVTGDSGSNPATNFLGTTDAQPLVLRTANARSLRIEPSSVTYGGPALPITTNSIGGSHANTVTAGVRGATIAGGGAPLGDTDPDLDNEEPNRVTDHYGSVGGGIANQAGDAVGTLTDGSFATVGGGVLNTARGAMSTIGGGYNNVAAATWSGALSGVSNSALGPGSSIGGGRGNVAGNFYSAVGGGEGNVAGGSFATVGGGSDNVASGDSSAVGGGNENCAGADLTWAGGRRAKVRPAGDPGGSAACSGLSYPGGLGDYGTFVWADAQNSAYVSTGPNQFLVRASGGMALNGSPIDAGVEVSVIADSDGPNFANLFLRQRDFNAGTLFSTGEATSTAANNAAFYIDQYNGSAQTRRLALEGDGDLVVTAQAFKPGGGSWSAPSDARLKTSMAPLTGALDRLLALRGTTFEYRADATPKSMYLAGPQIGFIAQEVEAVFPQWVGETPEGYKTVGPQGFEALTVEALRELRTESAVIDRAQQAQLAALEAEWAERMKRAEHSNAMLREELAALRALVESRLQER